ncbi:MAG: hydrogenase 4 membrane subunit [Crenarchaeota archaeon]|nr:hydrogenase 4 membrane subunit [Thermoproteota archaeon]
MRELVDAAVSILSLVMLMTALRITTERRLDRAAKIYALQSFMLVLIFLVMGIFVDHLFLVWSLSGFITKTILVPYILLWALRRIGVKYDAKPLVPVTLEWVLAGLSIGLSFALAAGIVAGSMGVLIPLAVSLSLFLIGLLQILTRRSTVKQILGLCHFENSSHLTLAFMAPRLPETVEIGMATDVILLVFFGSILTMMVYKQFKTLDTSIMTELKEVNGQ